MCRWKFEQLANLNNLYNSINFHGVLRRDRLLSGKSKCRKFELSKSWCTTIKYEISRKHHDSAELRVANCRRVEGSNCRRVEGSNRPSPDSNRDTLRNRLQRTGKLKSLSFGEGFRVRLQLIVEAWTLQRTGKLKSLSFGEGFRVRLQLTVEASFGPSAPLRDLSAQELASTNKSSLWLPPNGFNQYDKSHSLAGLSSLLLHLIWIKSKY
jgi:hypothetical protein